MSLKENILLFQKIANRLYFILFIIILLQASILVLCVCVYIKLLNSYSIQRV